MVWHRAFAVWLVIIGAETLHGILRQLFITPILGDLRARQTGVVVGSAIVLVIAVVFSRWVDARKLQDQLAVGCTWVALTAAFEVGLGALLGLTRERMLADYNLAQGGFMAFGLLFMLLAPVLAARVRRRTN